jgi:hypothetical protein
MKNITAVEAEEMVLSQVRFVNVVLEECRRRNKELAEALGASYAKFVGLNMVYEEGVCAFRKVKSELDKYLGILRTTQR